MDPDRLLFGLRDVTHAMLDRARQTAAGHGLAMPAMMALRAIDAAGTIRPGELASKLHITPGTLTPTLQGLEERGLIERRPDADDGRVHHLSLTPAGIAFRKVVEGQMRRVVGAAFDDWAPDELDAFVAGLERVRKRLAT